MKLITAIILFLFSSNFFNLKAQDTSSFIDLRDYKTYKTVTIGTQTWMAENLNVSTFRNGDPIPEAKTNEDWEKAGNEQKPAWYYYDFNSANGEKYGKLYNWYAVQDSRNLAPTGWKIPSDAEWTTLVNYLQGGNIAVAGGKLKETGTLHWASPNTGADNSSGFTALPGGYCNGHGIFFDIGLNGYWWSSTESDIYRALIRFLKYNSSSYSVGGYGKTFGISVRCLKGDNDDIPPPPPPLHLK